MTSFAAQSQLVVELERIGRQRDRLEQARIENHRALVDALRRGYELRVDVTRMAAAAGVSRQTAHKLLREVQQAAANAERVREMTDDIGRGTRRPEEGTK